MAVRLNMPAYQRAQQLIEDGRFVLDEADDWSEHQPTAYQENAFIRQHGLDEYRLWHLGVDEDEAEERKSRYRFPYGDFHWLHRCGVLVAGSRADQYRYHDIETAAAHLRRLLEETK
jgi:hypothetical protein